MRMATRELMRRPRSFGVPTAILLLLGVLLLYPSAVLDGIYKSTTGALRSAPADLVAFSDQANLSVLRSQVDAPTRARVEEVPGVAGVAGFDVQPWGARVSGNPQPLPLALLSSEQPLGGSQRPAPGEAIVDQRLREFADVSVGDQLLIGPFEVMVTVTGFTNDASLLLLPGVLVDKSTWLETLGPEAQRLRADTEQAGSSRAAESSRQAESSGGAESGGGLGAETGATGADETSGPAGSADQILFVRLADGADPAEVSALIDEATGGTTETVTRAVAVESLPGVRQQATTFGYVRSVTLTVALVVVALFLTFMTLERAPLYAVLKAIGMSSRQLFSGVVAQVLIVTTVALSAAAAITWGLTFLPLELPTVIRPGRLAETFFALCTTAVMGSILSLRRVMRIDPASALG